VSSYRHAQSVAEENFALKFKILKMTIYTVVKAEIKKMLCVPILSGALTTQK